MPTRIVMLVALVTSVALLGCASIKLNARSEVAAPNGLITTSPYAPEAEENCRELARENCRYWNDPFRSVQSQCTESVTDSASNAGANYIHVNEPKSSVGGFKTRAPVAIFYQCDNPIAR
jgi:hypothetical protein